MKRWKHARYLIAAVALAATCNRGSPQRGAQPAPEAAPVSALVQKVMAKSRDAIGEARAAGAAASPALLPLVRSEDAEIRELAMWCLAESGGPGAQEALVRGMLDESPGVRAAAMGGVQKGLGPAMAPGLLEALEKSPEPLVRRHAALFLGRIPGTGTQRIRGAYQAEKEGGAKEGELAALARLGDAEARRAFAARLQESSGPDRIRMVELAEYLAAPWLLPSLAPLLDDWTPAVRIGADGLPGPEYLRVCDVAVNLMASVTGQAFSFEVGPRRNYPAAAIDEVRAALKKLPPAAP
jgi:HEAT repeat protein